MNQGDESKSSDDKSSEYARSVSGQSISQQPHNRFQLPPKLGEHDVGQFASTTVLINSVFFCPNLMSFAVECPRATTWQRVGLRRRLGSRASYDSATTGGHEYIASSMRREPLYGVQVGNRSYFGE